MALEFTTCHLEFGSQDQRRTTEGPRDLLNQAPLNFGAFSQGAASYRDQTVLRRSCLAARGSDQGGTLAPPDPFPQWGFMRLCDGAGALTAPANGDVKSSRTYSMPVYRNRPSMDPN